MTEQIRQIKFHNYDSLEILKATQTDAYDLLIADPPYGIGMSKPAGLTSKYTRQETQVTDKKWDDDAPSKEFFDEMFRVSKNQIIWGANHFISRMPFDSSSWIVWDKRENIIPERTFADCELAWASYDKPSRIFRHYWDGFMQKQKEKRIHPTQKPVALYEWLLTKYATVGDRILDPFGGSFSSAIACDRLGYQLDIIELDKDYFNKGVARFKHESSQIRMF